MKSSRGLLRTAAWLPPTAALIALCLVLGGVSVRGLLLVAILLTLTLPLALQAAKGRLDLFEPLVLANFSLAVMFVGRPLADLATNQFYHLGYNVLPTFDEALFVALIGIVAFQSGYASPLGRNWARHLGRPPLFRPARLAALAWIYSAFGALLFWFFLAQYGGLRLVPMLLRGRAASDNALFLGSTGYLYNGILLWGAAALLFFAVAIATRRRHYFVWFLALLLPLLIFYGARGTRSHLLPVIVAVAMFWYLWRDRRPHLATLAVVLVVGLSLIGWMGAVRTAGERGNVLMNLEKALTSPVDQAANILTGPESEMFDSLATELAIVPERLPFQHGAIVTDILLRAVPRPFWPNKPLESNDSLVVALWPAHYAVSRASPAFSIIGSLYVDSGLITVALGMFLIGAVLSMFWRWLLRHRGHPVAQLIYAMGLGFVIILMRGAIPDTIARMLFLFVPLILLMVLARVSLFGRKRYDLPHHPRGGQFIARR